MLEKLKLEHLDAQLDAALVVQQWISVASGWDDPERSLFKAAQVVRSYAPELASAFGDAEQFITV